MFNMRYVIIVIIHIYIKFYIPGLIILLFNKAFSTS